MTINETVTLILSVSSLIISFSTLYLTYFNKVASLVGVLVIYNYQAKGKFKRELEYSISNTGNLQLVLKQVLTLVAKPRNMKARSFLHYRKVKVR